VIVGVSPKPEHAVAEGEAWVELKVSTLVVAARASAATGARRPVPLAVGCEHKPDDADALNPPSSRGTGARLARPRLTG
jgi:hypothetical protein